MGKRIALIQGHPDPRGGHFGHALADAYALAAKGMPAFFYRLYYRSHSVKSLKRNILEFCGLSPVRPSVIGMVEGGRLGKRELWLAKMQDLGRAAR